MAAPRIARFLAAPSITLALLGMVLPTSCLAQTKRLQQECSSAQGELKARACSDLIDLGNQTPAQRAAAYYNRARALEMTGKSDLALSDYIAAANQAPGNPFYRRELSNAYSMRRNFAEAMRIDPENRWVIIDQANYHENKGEFDSAIERYTAAINLALDDRWKASDRAQAYYSRGRIYFRAGDYERAISDFGESLKLDAYVPHNRTAWRCMAKLFAGQKASAKEDCDKASESDGNYLDFDIRALLFLKLDRLSLARIKAEENTYNGTYAYGAYVLAIVLEAQGDSTGAQQWFDRARDLAKPGDFAGYERVLRRYRMTEHK